MPWFKIDDAFYDNPKVKAIPRSKRMACLGLWVSAGTWSAKHLTDGRIPAYMVEEFGAEVSHGDTLVTCGLWRAEGDEYVFHDWLDWQPSRSDALAAREKERARKEAYRARKTGNTGQSPSGTRTDGANVSQDPVPVPDPYPTRPTKEKKNTAHPADAPGAQINRMFDTFWQAWPVKKGKEPARKSFIKAIKSGADMEAIMAGVEAYKAELGVLMGGKTIDGRTPKYAQGWLTDKRWEDEPSTASVGDINAQWDAAMGETKPDPCANGHKWAADDSCVRCLQLKNDNDEIGRHHAD